MARAGPAGGGGDPGPRHDRLPAAGRRPQGRGALNLFSDTPNAFDTDSADTGAIVAAFASVAVLAAEEHRRADELQHGLETNREIGKAIGLLMAAHQVTSDEAFQVLRRASSELNRKLADIARELVAKQQARS